MSKRQRFVQAITNPDTLFERDPSSPPPESSFNDDKLAQSRVARTLFSPNRDTSIPTYARDIPLSHSASVRSRSAHSHSHSRSPSDHDRHLSAITEASAPSPKAATAPAAVAAAPSPNPILDDPLFQPHLINPQVAGDLPEGYTIRPLQRGDYDRGYLDVLRLQSRVGWIGEVAWGERFDAMKACKDTYFTVVICEGKRVVAAGTLVAEKKFSYDLGIVGHIEDIVVSRDQKGRKMGLRVLEALTFISERLGCHRVVADSTEANEAFHGQAGYAKEGSMMVRRFGLKIDTI
ncbi:hypothetical protein BDY21DRAFT_285761 [Lineolata rhizophorae]|uniref:Glucosamine 6-phosphate N-acetyltransferase n=1 Tax=Lineolata rhizophorae TaxID=578093 RepID=A0A6A6P194_9PEZI|nr:hypothetical protein BDY21DRAFT_285761 [Lineolata rhizophorae]